MRWPWQRREVRQSFTDALTAALLADAEATTITASATAALEACASLYAMCFAAARIEDAPAPIAAAITPSCLALIARNLIRHGEDVHLIQTGAAGLMLRPVGTWDLRGGPDPAEWYIRANVYGPSATTVHTVMHASAVHCRYAVDPARPWLGLGPLQWASATGSLAGRLEAGLAAEAGASSAQLIPVPQDGGDGGDDDPLANLKADIGRAKGKVLLVETVAAGWTEGKAAAPQSDWKQQRIGPAWPEVLNEARRHVAEDVARACGVPSVLLDARAEGTSQREGLRRFAHLALEPLGLIVAEELALKLDAPGLRLDFEALMASDLAGRARAFKGFVEAGLTTEQAAVIVAVQT